MLDDLDPEPFGMDADLLDGTGTVGIAGPDHDREPLLFQVGADLGNRRGLPGPVHTGEQDLDRPGVGPDIFKEVKPVAQHVEEGCLQGTDHEGIHGLADLPVFPDQAFPDMGDDRIRCREGHIALEQGQFQFGEGIGNILLRYDQFPLDDEDLELVNKRRFCRSSGDTAGFSCSGSGFLVCRGGPLPAGAAINGLDAGAQPAPCSLQPFLKSPEHREKNPDYS